jgi:uncharacterized membrane protein YuzA (DUF378 family)
MLRQPEREAPMTRDEQQLQLLSIFHYIVAGLIGLFSLFPVIHLMVGLAMASGALVEPGAEPGERMFQAMFGWFFFLVALAIILVGLCLATCLALAGRFLARRERYTFCLVAAGVACTFFPFGTVLGVFSLLVLLRDSVRASFGQPPYAPVAAPPAA